MNKKSISIFLLLPFIVMLWSCNPYGNLKQYDDTPTSGNIKISCDETFYNIIDGELDTFHALYRNAHIDARYCSEKDAFTDLLNDSARIIVASRLLSDNEKLQFKKMEITPRELAVAIDAIALIVNPTNIDSILTPTQIQNILNGEIKDWKQLNKRNAAGQMLMVFDNVYSSAARYAKDVMNKGAEIKGNVFAVKSAEKIVEYVSTHPNAIGVLGVSYVSDADDPKTLSFLKTIRVVAMKNETDGTHYKPYQAYIARGLYPYTRKVYIISREARSGLGTGFASFVASDIGQKIILKMGIMPATQPVRIVGFSNNN